MSLLPPYSSNNAILYGRMVVTAYDLFKKSNGQDLHNLPEGWDRIADIYGISKDGILREKERIGLIAKEQKNPNHFAVVFRGTDSFMDWLVDFEFGLVPFKDIPDSGQVEKGFCHLFESLTVIPCNSSEEKRLADYFDQFDPDSCFSVIGHSLGAAIASLQALDLSYKQRSVELYTFASPRVGDEMFVSKFNTQVLRNYRLVNKPDIVPTVPLTAMGYVSLGGEILLDSSKQPVKRSITCFHSINTYLFLLGFTGYGLGECSIAGSSLSVEREQSNYIKEAR